MTFKYRYRRQITIAIVSIIILLATATIIFLNINKIDELESKKDNKEESSIKKKDSKDNEEKNTNENLISVDIKGEIFSPGLYTLKSSSRVIDVINAAGGLTENADTSIINLSKKITDEMVIIIYSKEQVSNFKKEKEMSSFLEEKCLTPDESSLVNGACITNEDSTSNLVNINTATKEELMRVSGIGEKKAEDIIKYRNEQGGFKSIEEIKNISGIGEAIFAKIKESITV